MGDAGSRPSEFHCSSKLSLADLKPGNHVAYFYEGDNKPVAVQFIKEGLKNNEKCIYVAHENGIKDVMDAFEDGVKKHFDSGQLNIIAAEDAYLRHGQFDPDIMITLLKESTDSALKEGHSGLRVTGEMTWALEGGSRHRPEKLIEYEAKLNKIFAGNAITAMCQYDRNKFCDMVLMDVLRTHPLVAVNGGIFKNVYYVPDASHGAQSRFDVCLENIQNGTQAQKEEAIQLHSENIEKYIKDNLGTVVLSLLLKKPMCGKEVMETIRSKMGVVLSSGTVYPMLHILMDDGLLDCKVGIKRKLFMPADEARIRRILAEWGRISAVLGQIFVE
jgi:DNA-binding PadR family transcriptional regulator